jgi:hypothetical protein
MQRCYQAKRARAGARYWRWIERSGGRQKSSFGGVNRALISEEKTNPIQAFASKLLIRALFTH